MKRSLEDVIQDELSKIPNPYDLVCVASKKANQLTSGYAPLVKSKFVKPASITLLEIAEGKVRMAPEEEE